MTFGMSIFRQGHVDVEAGGCGRGAQKSTGDIHASFRAFIKQDERDRGVERWELEDYATFKEQLLGLMFHCDL